VLTADGENIIASKKMYFITLQARKIICKLYTILTILKSIQDVSFRRLLPPPPVFPEKADFIFSASQRTWRLARFPGSCPEGETAWVADSGEMLAGCIPERFMARLVPSLPTLLELRLLPSSPDGREWSRIRMRVGDREVVDVRKTPQGWVFSDGSLADDQLCEQILQVWQNTAIPGSSIRSRGKSPTEPSLFQAAMWSFPSNYARGGRRMACLARQRRPPCPDSAALAAMVPPDRQGGRSARISGRLPADCARRRRFP
jgi:hypothetical protein